MEMRAKSTRQMHGETEVRQETCWHVDQLGRNPRSIQDASELRMVHEHVDVDEVCDDDTIIMEASCSVMMEVCITM